jgi:isoquinoline 1-oxidoreductase beta subunit
VASFDATDTKKVPGFVQIVEIPAPSYPMMFQPSGGIAVVADNTWAAIQGRKALKIVWDDGPHATYDSQAYRAALEQTARQPGKVLRSEGDFAAAFCERGQESRGGVLHPSQCARDDGAAVGDLPDRRRQGRSLDKRAKPASRA